MADRVDITRFVEPVTAQAAGALVLPFDRPEPTAAVRARVTRARERQRTRYAAEAWRLNAHAPGPVLRERWPLADGAADRLEDEVHAGRLTRRGAVRVHRVAWTVADLAGLEAPGAAELEVALRLRSGEPLLLDSLPRHAADAPLHDEDVEDDVTDAGPREVVPADHGLLGADAHRSGRILGGSAW